MFSAPLRRVALRRIWARMSLSLTLTLLPIFAAIAIFAGWRGSRPPNLLKGPRMMPWRAIMLFSAVICVLLLVHLATVVGVRAGR